MCLCTFKTRQLQLPRFSSTSPSMTPKGEKRKGKRSRCAFSHPTPWMVPLIFFPQCMYGRVSARRRGRIITHGAPDRADCGRPAGARGFVFHPFFGGTSCGLSVASVRPSDAAAINMRQRVWVSDSCTVDQGHTVLARSGRATPKKANAVCESTSWLCIYALVETHTWPAHFRIWGCRLWLRAWVAASNYRFIQTGNNGHMLRFIIFFTPDY